MLLCQRDDVIVGLPLAAGLTAEGHLSQLTELFQRVCV